MRSQGSAPSKRSRSTPPAQSGPFGTFVRYSATSTGAKPVERMQQPLGSYPSHTVGSRQQVHPQHQYIVEGFRILSDCLTVLVFVIALFFGLTFVLDLLWR